MKVNTGKNKMMKERGENEDLNILWNSNGIEQVASYEYMGTVVNKHGTEDEEINNRI